MSKYSDDITGHTVNKFKTDIDRRGFQEFFSCLTKCSLLDRSGGFFYLVWPPKNIAGSKGRLSDSPGFRCSSDKEEISRSFYCSMPTITIEFYRKVVKD